MTKPDPTTAAFDQPSQGIAVIGGGTMGTGIAYVFAMAGRPTTVVEPNDSRAAAMSSEIESVATNAVRRGKLDDAGATALRGRVMKAGQTTIFCKGEARELVAKAIGTFRARSPKP